MFKWLHEVNVKIYLAQAMTGLPQDVIYRHNSYCTKVLQKHGIMVFSPVTAEDVKSRKKKMNQPSQEQLKKFWKMDKFMIRHSHVLLDITGASKSQGLLHEIGLSRYFFFKPVVRVMKVSGPSVAVEEEDILAPTVEKAAKLIIENWGTPWKRLKWKFNLFRRCFWSYLKTRLTWWFDWL